MYYNCTKSSMCITKNLTSDQTITFTIQNKKKWYNTFWYQTKTAQYYHTTAVGEGVVRREGGATDNNRDGATVEPSGSADPDDLR